MLSGNRSDINACFRNVGEKVPLAKNDVITRDSRKLWVKRLALKGS